MERGHLRVTSLFFGSAVEGWGFAGWWRMIHVDRVKTTGVREGLAADFESEPVRGVMLELARRSLVGSTAGGGLPSPDVKSLPGCLVEPGACFVTLRKRGALRGCIGNVIAREALYIAIMDNTQGAALRDSRFPPVSAEEAGVCRIEISVLTAPEEVVFEGGEELLGKLRPHEDGVVLRVGGRMSTFLPQVWETIPDKVKFMQHLSRKAGLGGEAWREAGSRVERYRVVKVSEGG